MRYFSQKETAKTDYCLPVCDHGWQKANGKISPILSGDCLLGKGYEMKIILWIIAIIFIVGLLTLTGVFKLIF
ncbi:small membrane protein YohP [Pantoea stewartii]